MDNLLAHIFEPFPMTEEAVKNFAHACLGRFESLLSLAPTMAMSEVERLMPLYASILVGELDEHRSLSVLSIGSGIVRCVLREGADEANSLSFWRAAFQEPTLLLTLLEGVAEYVSLLNKANATPTHTDILQAATQTEVARQLIRHHLLRVPWDVE